MTKKHFVALAALVRETPALQVPEALDALAWFCYEQNPRFDWQTFLAACRPEKAPAPLAALRRHVTGAIERGEAEPVVEIPALPWHVVAVSSNHGAFGHKGVIVLNSRGEGLELTLPAYGSIPLPEVGAVLQPGTLPRSEVPPRKLPDLSPERAAEIIKECSKKY